MTSPDMLALLQQAVQARLPLPDSNHRAALRLFNGFLEGAPRLAVDLYGSTLVIFNHAEPPESLHPLITAAQGWLLEQFPWLQAVILKERGGDAEARRGRLVWGSQPDDRICEEGVWYAVDLRMNQDAGFYLDTRPLRAWLRQQMDGKTVLNTFAYTGSLGAAALAGGAARVVQTDLNPRFLALAKATCALNGFPVAEADFPAGDFFRVAAWLKQAGEKFDCAILDPPFFSTTAAGRVDLNQSITRLINKLRPLVRSGGWLTVVNNALYVPGAEFSAGLEQLCEGGWLALESILPVPPDVTGYPHTRVGAPPVDPAPFNHPTKMAVLRVFHR